MTAPIGREHVRRVRVEHQRRGPRRPGARPGTFTRLGWCLLCCAIGCGSAGLGLRIIELQLSAVAFAVPLVSAGLVIQGRAPCVITLTVPAHPLSQGEHAPVGVRIENPRRHPLPPLRLEMVLDRTPTVILIPRLSAGETHEEQLIAPTGQRGQRPVGPIRSVREDPLCLLRRYVVWTGARHLAVAPRRIHWEGMDGHAGVQAPSTVAGRATPANAPVSARRSRQARLAQMRPAHVVLLLDTRRTAYEDADDFELAVQVAASLGTRLLRTHARLTTITSDAVHRSPTVHDLLACYTTLTWHEPPLPGPARPVRRIWRPVAGVRGSRARQRKNRTDVPQLATDASAVLLVTGARISPGHLHALARALPGPARAIGIRCDTGGEVSFAGIGRFDLVTLTQLEDLPQAWQSVMA